MKQNMEEKTIDPLGIIVGGIALLFVVIALVMAAYTHLTAPEPWESIPGNCNLPGNLICLNHSLTEDNAKLVLGNNLGRIITITGISISEIEGKQHCSFESSTEEGLPLGQGQIITLESDTCGIRFTEAGTEYNYTFQVQFTYEGGEETLSFDGEISTFVKKR